MALSGSQYEQFIEALLSAFPTLSSLRQMVRFRLDTNLDEIALGDNLKEIIFKLIQAAEAEGWHLRLLTAALESRPNNSKLRVFAQPFGLTSTTFTESALERTIRQANSFLDVAGWRAKLGELETQVCRLEVPLSNGKISCGTGFLLGSDVVITNYHVMEPVIRAKELSGEGQPWAKPENVISRFDYKRSSDGLTLNNGMEYYLAVEDWLIDSSPMSPLDEISEPKNGVPEPDQLDYALLHLDGDPGNNPVGSKAEPGAPKRGWIKLPAHSYDFQPHTPLLILQHPQAQPLKLAFDTDSIINLNGNKTRVTYKTNTEGGASGSPCFNINWELVALHHAGDPNFLKNYQPTYNQGIPFATILTLLEQRGLSEILGKGNS